MVARHVFVLLGCWLLAGAGPLGAQAPASSRLCWREGVRLQWSDFQAPQCYDEDGSPCSYATVVGAATSAIVPVVGFIDERGQPDYHVSCMFLRDSSWVNPRLVKPSDRAFSLAHEQIHFDIAELVARKIRRYVTAHKAAGDDLFGPAAAADIPCLLSELKSLNALYDNDVNFRPPAVEAAAQRRWAQLVARELRALARYKSTAATCPE